MTRSLCLDFMDLNSGVTLDDVTRSQAPLNDVTRSLCLDFMDLNSGMQLLMKDGLTLAGREDSPCTPEVCKPGTHPQLWT